MDDDTNRGALENLVEEMTAGGFLNTPQIRRAFLTVERADFVAPGSEGEAYGDYPLPIGRGQTISQPSTVAFTLELLRPEAGQKILDVGSGSGWTTALLAHLIGTKGEVIGVERIPELVEFGRANLAKYDFVQAAIEPAGSEFGLPEKAPFERILVSAAAAKIPQTLIDQLAKNGRLVIPVQNSVYLITKDGQGTVNEQEFPGFAFVPLI